MEYRTITVFDNFANTTSPIHAEVDKVLLKMKNPVAKHKQLIDSIRSESDEKKRRELKKQLPCVLFSGTFSARNDKSITEHSGLAVVDFDHVDSTEMLKDKLKLINYVYSAFESPSGDGVKAVVCIPKSIENHRENYEAVMEDLMKRLNIPASQFDKSSINESRICYASVDENIYINRDAKCFYPKEKKLPKLFDYSKLNVAINMINIAADGEKHVVLLKAAKLLGGYIASGALEETTAVQILQQAIRARDIDDPKSADKTIEDGIAYGKRMPIYQIEEIEENANIDVLRIRVSDSRRKYEFLSDPIEDAHDLERYRKGGFKQGEPTGHPHLDEYFRFKEGEFNVVLGHANVGKSFFMWWLMVLAAVRLDWNWIVYSTENKIRQIQKKLMEFYTQTSIQDMDDAMFNDAKEWMNEHFTFIRIDRMYSALELLDFAKLLMKEKEYKGFLIDPYNSLSIDQPLWQQFKGSRHEYDYNIASQFVNFCDKNNISIYLNAHAVTEALRKVHSKKTYKEDGHRYGGQPMPPNASDIEGGGKFVNRVTGFFMVIHRYIYDNEDWGVTKVEIKKVKDVETGGKPTRYESPIDFRLIHGMTYFVGDLDGGCVIPYKKKPSQSSLDLTASPAQAFDDEPF